MNAPQSPLSVRNYTEINRALGMLNDAEIELDRAERAGYPVDEQRMALKYFRELFNKTKAEYFSDRP
jgi:hypothetical protein